MTFIYLFFVLKLFAFMSKRETGIDFQYETSSLFLPLCAYIQLLLKDKRVPRKTIA